MLSEVEFNAERLFGDSSTASTDRLQYGHAVLGTWTTAAGGTVFTTGCTDWVHGLGVGDRDVETVTHNLLRRLWSRSG